MRDYRKKAIFYDYFEIHHPTCEAATERHVSSIFGRLALLVLAYIAVAWIGTAIFGPVAGWFFIAAGLYLGFLAGYPAKGHPVDKLRYNRFFGVFAAAVLLGTLFFTLFASNQALAQSNIVYARLYPQYMTLFPAILIDLIVVYVFVKRDEITSDDAYSAWQDRLPRKVEQAG